MLASLTPDAVLGALAVTHKLSRGERETNVTAVGVGTAHPLPPLEVVRLGLSQNDKGIEPRIADVCHAGIVKTGKLCLIPRIL